MVWNRPSGILRKTLRDEDPLALATRQVVDLAARQVGDVESLEVYLTLAVMFGWTDQEAAASAALAEVGS